MYNRKVVGQRIRNLRLKREWTQDKLAEKANISSTYVGEIERAVKSASMETLEKIASTLDTSLPELLSFSGKLENIEHPEVLIKLIDLLANRPIDEQESVYEMATVLLNKFDRHK